MAHVIVNKAGGGAAKIEKIEGLQEALDSKIPYQAFESLEDNSDFDLLAPADMPINTLIFRKIKVLESVDVHQPIKTNNSNTIWYVITFKTQDPATGNSDRVVQYAFNIMSDAEISGVSMLSATNVFVRQKYHNDSTAEDIWSNWSTFSTSDITGNRESSSYQKPIHFSVEGNKVFANFFNGNELLKKELGSLVSAELEATPADVLNGVKFGGKGSDDPQYGTIPNYKVSSKTSRKKFTPSLSAQSYTIPKGYYEGENVVECDPVSLSGNAAAANVLTGKTFYNTTLSKVTGSMSDLSASSGITLTSSDSRVVRNAREYWLTTNSDSQKSVCLECPTTGYYTDKTILRTAATNFGTATAANVLSGATFTSTAGLKVSGTMANKGAVSASYTPSFSAQTYTVPAGYHNGSGKITVNAMTKPNSGSRVISVHRHATGYGGAVGVEYTTPGPGVAIAYAGSGSPGFENATTVFSPNTVSGQDQNGSVACAFVDSAKKIKYKITGDSRGYGIFYFVRF